MGAGGRAAVDAVGGAHVPRAGAAQAPAARQRPRTAPPLQGALGAGNSPVNFCY